MAAGLESHVEMLGRDMVGNKAHAGGLIWGNGVSRGCLGFSGLPTLLDLENDGRDLNL